MVYLCYRAVVSSLLLTALTALTVTLCLSYLHPEIEREVFGAYDIKLWMVLVSSALTVWAGFDTRRDIARLYE